MKTLADRAATVAFLESGEPCDFQTVSQWLVQLLTEYERTVGFPCNRVFQSWLEQREGWSIGQHAALARLIYNAQGEHERTAPTRAGFVPLTAEMVAEAKRTKRGVLVFGALVGHEECRPGNVNGTPCVFRHRSRTRYFPLGTMARLSEVKS